MKKYISILLTVITVLSLCASCGRDKSVVLFFAVRDTAGSFDPQIADGETTRLIVRNCFEGLVAFDPDGNIAPGVAESWEISEDGRTYTFRLRPDAVWHLTTNAAEQLAGKLPEDFAPHVTAQDFVFALRRAVDPATASRDAYLFVNVAGAEKISQGKAKTSSLGVRAINDTVLEIRLEKPQSNFLELLTYPAAMPCNEEFFTACAGRYGTYIRFLLSDGPFYLSRFDETSYRINKNPDYHGSQPARSDAIWFYYSDDRDAVLEELSDNGYSGAVVTAQEKEKLSGDSGKTFTETKNILRSLIFNINDPLLSCADLRRAFTSATNASLIAANAGMPYCASFVPECAASPAVTEHPVMYNESNAAQYLEKAYKQLDTDGVTLTVLCENRHEELMRKLLQEWQRILGISVVLSVQPVSEQELLTAAAKGSYQIAFCPVRAETDRDWEYFGAFTPARADHITAYSNVTFTKLLPGLHGSSEKASAKVYSGLEQKLADVSVMLPVWSESSYFVTTKGVSGVLFGAGGDKLRLNDAVTE